LKQPDVICLLKICNLRIPQIECPRNNNFNSSCSLNPNQEMQRKAKGVRKALVAIIKVLPPRLLQDLGHLVSSRLLESTGK